MQAGALSEFAKYPQLKILHFDTEISDSWLKELVACKNLESLSINRMVFDGSGVQALAKSPKLSELSLNGAFTMTDDHVKNVAGLKNVKSLILSGFSLTDACLPHLAKMKQLEKLSLYTTKITPEGAKKLNAALPKCSIDGV